MQDEKLKVAIGGLLHDVGKVLYRSPNYGNTNHSTSGYKFLKEEIGMKDPEILDQVRYHHADYMKGIHIPENSPAYITYMADNIASAADRREKEDGTGGFSRYMPLDSIFNTLNHPDGKYDAFQYHPKTMNPDDGINFPTEEEIPFDKQFYGKIQAHLTGTLKELFADDSYKDSQVNSLLELLEADLSFIPSSTSKQERADISLFDHVKITAALGCCIWDYLQENGITDWKKLLFTQGSRFHERRAFLLFSMDMSGIQAFIYHQYGTSDVLKNLRARSFYLDIMMENAIDDLLDELELSRANLIYSGGGHAYLLLANTPETVKKVDQFEKSINTWLQKTFGADLYLACGHAACSSNDLQNKNSGGTAVSDRGSYSDIFRRVSQQISRKKIHRYTAEELIALNHSVQNKEGRECSICHRSDNLIETEDGKHLCRICNGLRHLSRGILKGDFFSVTERPDHDEGIVLGKDRYLIADSADRLRRRMMHPSGYVRTYAKNAMYTGEYPVTKLWVGDYSSAGTLSELVDAGTGIHRLGVLRADIDNLGQAFVAGFPEQYQTLSRSATFSRKLSLFFKFHINDILKHGRFSLDGRDAGERSAAIIYSGGDDVFIVGAWKDVLEFAIDLEETLKEFTQNTLTVSAGFGIYDPKYPISYIASQTGDLEDDAKHCQDNGQDKNAIALFDGNNTYHWDIFINQVLGEKFAVIYHYFQSEVLRKNEDSSNTTAVERGKSFLYRMLDLFRNREEKINLARLAYTLSRLEPDKNADDNVKEAYRAFAQQVYEWMRSDTDSQQAITAIYLYAYLIRGEKEEEDA